MATGTPLAKLGAPAKFAAFVSLDGERVATTNDGPLSVLDVTTGIPVTRLDWLKGSELTLSPNGQSVVTFGLTRGSQSQVFNMAAGKSLAPLGGEAYSAKFSHDSLRVVTAEFAGVRVCDAISGRQLAIMAGSAGSATSAHAEYAEFSGDGTRVVAAMSDSTARIWEAATGDQLAVLTGHSERVGMAVFSPDGQRVLTSSQDGTVRLWDAATGAPLARLNLPPLPDLQ